MGKCNAYFYLNIVPNRTSLRLIPQQEGGEALDINEIDEYLKLRNIAFEKNVIVEALVGLTEEKEVTLNNKNIGVPEDESVQVYVSNDKLKAIGRFYPPSNGGTKLTKESIVQAMVDKGVKFGLKEDEIQSFLEHKEYCKDYELAVAVLPKEGTDAKIEYHFNTEVTRKPLTLEDGSVDFHQLDNLVHINKDALLAELFPAQKGTPGINVCGLVIKPPGVVVKNLKFGKNINVNEDRTKIYSMIDGHVALVEDSVHVSDVYEIQDVDTTTGDVHYDGSVKIKGNVRTGYKVFAKGDIIVDGVVEGATLEAGGQIILKLGIQGMGRAVLKAGGNIVSKFIESAEVFSEGCITAECILHSKVSAQGDITVNGKKGFISGSEIRSTTMITAKTAGSTMGTATHLEVGVSPEIIDEYRRMEKELPNLTAELERTKQTVAVYQKRIAKGEKLSADKVKYLKTTLESIKEKENKITEYQSKMSELQTEMDNNENGYIKVMDTIYPGCKIVISGVILYIRTVAKRCKFVRDGADVKAMTY